MQRILKIALIFVGAFCLPIRSANAQAPAGVVYKDPSLATILGFIVPGAGQMYAGKAGQGIVEFLVTAVGAGIAIRSSSSSCVGSCSDAGIGAIAAIAAWGFGFATAGRDARLYNQRVTDELAGTRRRAQSTPPAELWRVTWHHADAQLTARAERR